MGMYMKENERMMKEKGKEFLNLQLGMFMKENEKMI